MVTSAPLVVILLSLLLLGCGGGGGGGGGSTAAVGGEEQTDSDLGGDNSGSNIDTGTTSDQPNILLIIADDQGLDASAQYALSSDLPVTPTLNQLASQGIIFDNAWATPACTTTRSTMITGQYGVNSGVLDVGDKLPVDALTLQRFLSSDESTDNYQSAVIGRCQSSRCGGY